MKETVKNETVKKEQYELIMEAKRIQGSKNGEEYDFLSFEGFEKTGKKCRFIFTKQCNNVPEKVGTYKVIVDRKDINKDKQNRYSRYYIKSIISCEVFDGTFDNSDDEPLPF